MVLKNLIITFAYLLNPDILVIYRESVTKEKVDYIISECKKTIKEEILPEVIIANNFSEDFKNGIKNCIKTIRTTMKIRNKK